MGDYDFTPWRRYGHDRIYVNRDGATLGFLDRATDVLVVDDAIADDVRTALVRAGLVAGGDTAANRAGASARAQAEALRAAAPVRTALARVLNVHTDERAWRRGAEGEETIARRLARLQRDGWTIVHDLPIGDHGANVDHLAVGPAGAFSLNTKNLTGRVWVGGDDVRHNGQRTDYASKARWEAARVARALSRATGTPVYVRGVVVVLADNLTVKRQPRAVEVVGGGAIRRWLAAQPDTLDAGTVERLAAAVRDPRTWGTRP